MICAGGTGGGVYPALTVLEALQAEEPALNALWVGGEGGMEARLVERAGIPFRAIPAAGVHGVGLRQLPGNLARLGRGVIHARRILKDFQPQVLFFTGGYVAVPMAVAGRRTPSLLYVPDIEPGLALRTLSGFAKRIAVTSEESRRYFKQQERISVTGYPVRAGLKKWTRAEARQLLGIGAESRVVLVSGGSRGARSLNQAVLANLPTLLETAELIHITGELDWAEISAQTQAVSPENRRRWHVQPYLHEEMGAALAAADLAVSRAGASVLGEYPLFGLPAVLVPYPYAWRYQKVNAGHLVRQGGAVILEDGSLQEKLVSLVQELLGNPGRLEGMRAAMEKLAQPQAAVGIGHLLKEMTSERR